MQIKFIGATWYAEVLCSEEHSDGLHHVEIRTNGDSMEDALEGVQFAMKMVAEGRETYIRAQPEVSSYLDFDTKKMLHRGYARFSFALRPGTHTVLPTPTSISLGAL